MHTIDCLLSVHNTKNLYGISIAERIKAHGKECLWNERPSPKPDVIVIHYISAREYLPQHPFNDQAILKILCEKALSAHYLIDREGVAFRLVPDEMRAWHAGGSIMPEPDNRRNVNDFSIGIELAATPVSGFTEAQYDSLTILCKSLMQKFVCPFTFVGHEHVAGERAVELGLRSDVKVDPGALFDWQRLNALLTKAQ
ncbi:MAG: N-acetylmuramoyl-L-alanine amidase [Chitinivibrionales bacterium]|nr:N-acetylmuramoyl-L-alanine amidase [Chitinivibrionales bacterium]